MFEGFGGSRGGPGGSWAVPGSAGAFREPPGGIHWGPGGVSGGPWGRFPGVPWEHAGAGFPGPGARAQMGGLPFEPRPGEVEGQDVLGRLLWGDGPGEEPCGGDPKSKENTWPSKRHKHTHWKPLPLLSLMPPTGGRISLTIFIRPDMAASLLAAQPPFLIL